MRAAFAAVALAIAFSSCALGQNIVCFTPSLGDNSNKCAPTAFVQETLGNYAPLNSPSFTGSPTAPTPGSNISTTQIPTTAWVNNWFIASSIAASTYAPIASPTLTGTARAPTPASDTNDTVITTEAWVHNFIISAINTVCSTSATRPTCIALFGHANLSWFGQADWCSNLDQAIAYFTNGGYIFADAAAGNNSCGGSGTLILPNGLDLKFDAAQFTLNRMIEVKIGDRLHGVGGGNVQGAIPTVGSTLFWTGASGGNVIEFFDASFSKLDHLTINANAVSNTTAIQIDSDNSPISTRNVLDHFTITKATRGVVIGSQSNTAVSGASCNTTPSQDGCSENDFWQISNFQILGNCGDTTDEGVHINSLNGAQASRIDTGNISCVNTGVNIINMNGNFTIYRINAGSMQGTNPTLINIGSSVINGPDIVSCESEAGTYAVHNSAAGGATRWEGNEFNQQILIDGAARVTSIANGGGGTPWTVGGTAHVISIGDINVSKWTTSASGTVTVLGN